MAKQVGIAYPVKNDILLKKGELLHFVTDNNKFWFAVEGKQITEPRKGNRDKNHPHWLKIGFKRILAEVR